MKHKFIKGFNILSVRFSVVQHLLHLIINEKMFISQVPIKQRGRVIGRGGQNVAQLAKDYKVNIQLPKDQTSSEFEIRGAEENCENAKQAIIKIVENQSHEMTEQVILF